MPSFEEINEILGFNSYYEEEKRYSTGTSQPPSQIALGVVNLKALLDEVGPGAGEKDLVNFVDPLTGDRIEVDLE
ncbi:hypothetical protein L484_021727 [Morus notabilis]|uniref:Uncharacterized protein n=1 Tax=Morus notabilis TaxID=981085 RepID=W9S6Z1_9ROSA|nr:hypothetical protein L484_021727 [Morus notabilis]